MEPTFSQLRNRIKYVEALRLDKNEDHGYWIHPGAVSSRGFEECGQCAVGLILKKFNITHDTNTANNICSVFLNVSGMDRLHRNYDILFYIERQQISMLLGLNYLEIMEISDYFEGFDNRQIDANTCNQHNYLETAQWFEDKHIKPFLWMIEGHHEVIKAKCVRELQEVI